MKRILRIASIVAVAVAALACSTTRVLGEKEYRLASNEVVVNGADKDFNTNQIYSYIRQDSNGNGIFGWNPFLCVYNWSLKDGFFHKIGTAPVVYDSTATQLSIANIRTRLDYLGYYNSAVRVEESKEDKVVDVKYIVDLGKRYTIDTLLFDIQQGSDFTEDFPLDSAQMRKALLGEYLSEQMLSVEAVRSAAFFRDKGYFDFTKNNYSFEADTLSDGTAKLIYRIRGYGRGESEEADRPLTRYHIGNVSVSRPRYLKFNEKVIRGLNTIHSGDLYSETTVNTTYSRLSNLKAFSSVGIEMTPVDTSTVDCVISLTPSRPQGFKVNLQGSTNSSGLLAVSPQFSYYNKNIFRGGEWLSLGFNGDFQFSTKDDTRATEIGVSAGLSFPRFLGLPYSMFKGVNVPRTEINLAFSHQMRPEFTRNIVSTSFGYTGVFTRMRNISYQLYPLRVNFVKLYNLDSEFEQTLLGNPFMRYAYQDHLDAGVSAAFYYNSSNDIVPQSSYTTHRLSIDLSGNALSLFKGMMSKNEDGFATLGGSPFAQYVRAEYAFARSWKYTENTAVAVRFLAGAGYAYGNSSALPFEKQFYSGGASSMRGWQARALGPGAAEMNNFFSIPSQTGDMKLEANVEYRFNMFWKLEGALFSDVGNVWTFNFDDDFNQGAFYFKDFYKTLAADWGIGLRVNLNFILLRLDFGMKLIDPSLEEGSRIIGASQWLKSGYNAFHFGVGYPF